MKISPQGLFFTSNIVMILWQIISATTKSYGGEKLRNLIKFLSVLGAVVCTLIFVLIYFAQTTIPERVTIVEKTSYNMPQIFGFDLFNINSKTNLDVLRNNNEIIEQDAEIELLNIIPIKNINFLKYL